MSRGRAFVHFAWSAFSISVLLSGTLGAQVGLQVTYSDQGVQTLSYQGMTLEDVGQYPSDAFHIWHIKATDLAGTVVATGQYGWGENNNGTRWDTSTHTKTYDYVWGSIATRFIQRGDILDITVTETNRSDSGIILCGAEIDPVALHFPQDPKSFAGYSQYAITTTGPGVSVADYGLAIVTSVIPDESKALYGGWKNIGGSVYVPLMTSTAPDGLASFLPHNDLPVQPGGSLTYTVSLRFTPEGTPADASDAYSSFAAVYPSQMTWKDRRIIGTAYLASSPANPDITRPGGFPQNPRRYFNDASIDVYSALGLSAFQQRILSQANTNVATANMLNSQGVITWDIEGEQFPQNTSYVCSPDQISMLAPEMESVIADSTSPYSGWKLDDAYFKIMTDAGLKVGICLRPQQFVLHADGSAVQMPVAGVDAVVALLEAKARYASSRWGVTMFYVDSTVNADGGTLDPAIFQRLIADLPDFLFIPEESTPRYYAYSAPFYSFLFHGDLGTPEAIYSIYPNAFGANLVNDVSPQALAAATGKLTQAVARGDILMGHADYWQQNDAALLSIYQAAGASLPTPINQIAPNIFWTSPRAISYGFPLSANELNAAANVAGTFTYSPGLGAILPAGMQLLSVTFQPADSAYKTVSASVSLQVNPAQPAITWPAPSPIAIGEPLSSAQLNASANIPGKFVYSPPAESYLAAGIATLQTTFIPDDALDYQQVMASVPILVQDQTKITPTITWNVPAPIVYPTALSLLQLNAQADVPGTFVYTQGAGTLLGAGIYTLGVTFLPTQADRYSSVSRTVQLQVKKGAPLLTWVAPQSILAGSALSSEQLNARANVAGAFVYTPDAGAAPLEDITLSAVFLPTDNANYESQQISVPLTISQPIATPVDDQSVQVVWPTAGTTISGQVFVLGLVQLTLDSAGSYLVIDGQEVGTRRIVDGPYRYELDTSSFSNGTHELQLWCHDIGNNTKVSMPVSIQVAN